MEGPNHVSNGILLRADIHRLFDKGIMTVTPDLRMEISKDVRSEYEDSTQYLALHGHKLQQLPRRGYDLPSQKFLTWHNENRFRG